MKQPMFRIVSKAEFTTMSNKYGAGRPVRCPKGCGSLYFRAAKSGDPSAFVCDVCKTEIVGA